jgi:hypothetical protein
MPGGDSALQAVWRAGLRRSTYLRRRLRVRAGEHEDRQQPVSQAQDERPNWCPLVGQAVATEMATRRATVAILAVALRRATSGAATVASEVATAAAPSVHRGVVTNSARSVARAMGPTPVACEAPDGWRTRSRRQMAAPAAAILQEGARRHDRCLADAEAARVGRHAYRGRVQGRRAASRCRGEPAARRVAAATTRRLGPASSAAAGMPRAAAPAPPRPQRRAQRATRRCNERQVRRRVTAPTSSCGSKPPEPHCGCRSWTSWDVS